MKMSAMFCKGNFIKEKERFLERRETKKKTLKSFRKTYRQSKKRYEINRYNVERDLKGGSERRKCYREGKKEGKKK